MADKTVAEQVQEAVEAALKAREPKPEPKTYDEFETRLVDRIVNIIREGTKEPAPTGNPKAPGSTDTEPEPSHPIFKSFLGGKAASE